MLPLRQALAAVAGHGAARLSSWAHASLHAPAGGLPVQAPRRWRTLRGHGTAVGLPSDADMGNSEVGGCVPYGQSNSLGCILRRPAQEQQT